MDALDTTLSPNWYDYCAEPVNIWAHAALYVQFIHRSQRGGAARRGDPERDIEIPKLERKQATGVRSTWLHSKTAIFVLYSLHEALREEDFL